MLRVQGSLSRQLLGWQLLIIILLLASIAVFSVAQTDSAFRATEGRKMLSVAEDLAATSGVRVSLADPYRRDALPIFAESTRNLSGADYVIITDNHGIVLTSPDPAQRGQSLPPSESTALAGRSWVGEMTVDGSESLVAQVPVISNDARIIGVVAATATP